MSILPSKRYYCYLLKYQDGRVFYVGKGTGARVFAHAVEARQGCQCRKCITIRGIWELQQSVEIRIVFESDSSVTARLQEMLLIEQHGSPTLTNTTPAWSGATWHQKPAKQRSCPSCSHIVTTRQYSAAVRWGHCRYCKQSVETK